jgi:hypothetical protein
MIRMMATTISSSISEKPFCFRISFFLPSFLNFEPAGPLLTQSLQSLHLPGHPRQRYWPVRKVVCLQRQRGLSGLSWTPDPPCDAK